MIEITHLSKSFGDLRVLEDISLHINDGEIYGIIGQSGAGKSTLLRCINGLESYQEGSVKIDGQEVRSLSTKELHALQKQMGMIFQNFNLLSRLNVFDNVALPMRFAGLNPRKPENKQRILDLIELVGLSDKLKAKPRELSGGQKQRVAIARALVLNPRILLCDEATSALDPRITQGILSLLTKIRDEMGITVVVVTHQMEVVKQICERVSFLKDSRLIQEGRPEELFVMPNEDIRAFLGKIDEALPDTGRYIKLFFTENAFESEVISTMARELNVPFSICRANLEDFRGKILGSLVLNVRQADGDRVLQYLSDKNIIVEEGY
ncbi:MAG: methionine ABC transporter ATP-binding protein [Clostridia bacterium]|nr:methionine ABC transporter ATP-binding protein [Clostridia bacterium]